MRILPTLLLALPMTALAAACATTNKTAEVQVGVLTLRIVGMTCAVNCPPRVKSALESVAGVEEATVDYDTRTATVRCASTCDREALVAALQKQGFGAAPQ